MRKDRESGCVAGGRRCIVPTTCYMIEDVPRAGGVAFFSIPPKEAGGPLYRPVCTVYFLTKFYTQYRKYS